MVGLMGSGTTLMLQCLHTPSPEQINAAGMGRGGFVHLWERGGLFSNGKIDNIIRWE